MKFSLHKIDKHSNQGDIIQEIPEQVTRILQDYRTNCEWDKWILGHQAWEIRDGYNHDKLLSLSNSRTSLLPHQIKVAHTVVNSNSHRYILADEVGLGKTIEAGLILKELQFRFQYKNILIVTPASLQRQWVSELKEKFNEDYTLVDRKLFLKDPQILKSTKRIIVSLDFIKLDKYAPEVLDRDWDIVIFDEAHRLRREQHKVTRAYAFASELSKKTNALLLLTATPFRGKLEELYYLTQLINPHLLGSFEQFYNDYVLHEKSDLRDKISNILLRHRKIEVGGFTKRLAKTVGINLSPTEDEFYQNTSAYVKSAYNLALNTKRQAIGFVMVIYQRLLDSSNHALLTALKKRLLKLETMAARQPEPDADLFKEFEEKIAEVDGNDFELETLLCDYELSFLENITQEIKILKKLIRLGTSIEKDSKLARLVSTMRSFRKRGVRKFLIFTEFRSTQDYLAAALQEFNPATFHGGLSAVEKEDAVEAFRLDSDVLICTEAGGEGRNLQWANVLINYDLPWSPLKIEQRIGRLHRFGQKEDVWVVNLTTRGTVAERVLEVIQNKIDLFETAIGEQDELLGLLQSEFNFEKTFARYAMGHMNKKQIKSEVEQAKKLAEEGYSKLNDLLSVHNMDFDLSRYYSYSNESRAIDNDHIADFICDYYRHTGRPLQKQAGHFLKDGTAGTFSAADALLNPGLEFWAVGHPVVDGILAEQTTLPISPFIQQVQLKRSIRPADHRIGEVRPVLYAYGQFILFCEESGQMIPKKISVCLELSTGKAVSLPVLDGSPVRKKTDFNINNWPAKHQLLWQLAENAATAYLSTQERQRAQNARQNRDWINKDYTHRVNTVNEKIDRALAKIKWEAPEDFVSGNWKPEWKSRITRLTNEKEKLQTQHKAALAELDDETVFLNLNLHHLLLFHY